jgi:NMD protein affecting ribosome stability and mRNA decay
VATKLRTWYKVLPDLIENYNTTFHSTIKAKPLDVFEGRDKNKQTNIVQYEPSYAVGDIVRIKQVKPILGKGDYIKYSEETYIITGTRGKRYYLKNTSTDETASRPYKDYEIKKATDIVTYEPPPDEGVRDVRPEETIAKERRTKKKVTEELQNIGDYLKAPKGKSWVREGKRKTKPTQKLDI